MSEKLALRFFLAMLLAVLLPNIELCAQHMNEKDSPCAQVVITADLVECLAKARDVADTQLNSIYKNVQTRLDASEADHLNSAQRLWVQYRDANCLAERELYGMGTASNPAYLACLEAMTRARTRELQVTYSVRLK